MDHILGHVVRVVAVAICLLTLLPVSPALAQAPQNDATAEANRAAIDAFYPVMIEAVAEGRLEAARELCHKAISWEPKEPVHFYNLACIEAKANNINLGLAALTKAIDLGYANAESLAQDADLDNLRSSPIFLQLTQRISANAQAAPAIIPGSNKGAWPPEQLPGSLKQAEPLPAQVPGSTTQAVPTLPVVTTEAPRPAAVDPAFSQNLPKETQPAAAKVSDKAPVGLFFMTRYWPGTGSLEKAVWYFAPDGMAYEDPAGGFSQGELAAHAGRKAKISSDAKQLTFTWSDGSRPSTGSYEPNPGENSFYWDMGSFTPVRPFTDTSAVIGTWQGGISTKGASVSRTLELRADGTFSLSGAASLRAESPESTATAGSYGGVTQGTWKAGQYSLTLTAGGDAAKRGVAFPYDGKFYFDGIMWSRL